MWGGLDCTCQVDAQASLNESITWLSHLPLPPLPKSTPSRSSGTRASGNQPPLLQSPASRVTYLRLDLPCPFKSFQPKIKLSRYKLAGPSASTQNSVLHISSYSIWLQVFNCSVTPETATFQNILSSKVNPPSIPNLLLYYYCIVYSVAAAHAPPTFAIERHIVSAFPPSLSLSLSLPSMSFLFGRAKSRAAADLPRQAREHISKLDTPNGPQKVAVFSFHLLYFLPGSLADAISYSRPKSSLESSAR